MEDEKKDPAAPGWRHGEDLSFRKVVPALHALRAAVERQLEAERARLAEVVKVRDSLKK